SAVVALRSRAMEAIETVSDCARHVRRRRDRREREAPSTDKVESRRDAPEQPHNDMDRHDRQVPGAQENTSSRARWTMVPRLSTSILPKRARDLTRIRACRVAHLMSGARIAKRRRVQGGCLLGPGAEEGRGERRNVPGELQASDEPGGPEW